MDPVGLAGLNRRLQGRPQPPLLLFLREMQTSELHTLEAEFCRRYNKCDMKEPLQNAEGDQIGSARCAVEGRGRRSCASPATAPPPSRGTPLPPTWAPPRCPQTRSWRARSRAAAEESPCLQAEGAASVGAGGVGTGEGTGRGVEACQADPACTCCTKRHTQCTELGPRPSAPLAPPAASPALRGRP